MSPTHCRGTSRRRSLFEAGLIVSTLFFISCGRDTGPVPFEPQFAPGGGGPPVKVTATDPTSGEQGATLSVRVLGANFEPGSVAEFKLQGAPGKVHTNSMTFVSEEELVADVTIEGDADLGLYDVEVRTPRGKKGVGTELFEVRMPGTTGNGIVPLSVTLRDDAADEILSDGTGDYVDGAAGIQAELERQFVYSTTGSAPLPPVLRRICFDFGSASVTWFGTAGPICATAIWNTSFHDNDPDGMKELTVGATMTAYSRFIFRDPATNKQVWVQFGDYGTGGLSSPNRIIVRRLDQLTWELETTTQNARVLREGEKFRGKTPRDTLGFVPMAFRATLRAR